MQEVLRIDVVLDRIETVQGAGGEVTMILFHGNFNCELGSGKVLPGGVDTQTQRWGEDKFLSARYILEGKDQNQKPFRIFVENNGICKEGGGGGKDMSRNLYRCGRIAVDGAGEAERYCGRKRRKQSTD